MNSCRPDVEGDGRVALSVLFQVLQIAVTLVTDPGEPDIHQKAEEDGRIHEQSHYSDHCRNSEVIRGEGTSLTDLWVDIGSFHVGGITVECLLQVLVVAGIDIRLEMYFIWRIRPFSNLEPGAEPGIRIDYGNGCEDEEEDGEETREERVDDKREQELGAALLDSDEEADQSQAFESQEGELHRGGEEGLLGEKGEE